MKREARPRPSPSVVVTCSLGVRPVEPNGHLRPRSRPSISHVDSAWDAIGPDCVLSDDAHRDAELIVTHTRAPGPILRYVLEIDTREGKGLFMERQADRRYCVRGARREGERGAVRRRVTDI